MDDDGSETIGRGGTNAYYFTVESAYSLRHQNCTIVGCSDLSYLPVTWKWR